MRRIGAIIVVAALAIGFFIGCEEEIEGLDPTGFQLRFAALNLREVIRNIGGTVRIDTVAVEQECLTFAVWVFVDDEYQGRASTDEPKFFSLGPGTYDLYLRSNMRKATEDAFYSWVRRFSVHDGTTTFMTFYTDTTFTGL